MVSRHGSWHTVSSEKSLSVTIICWKGTIFAPKAKQNTPLEKVTSNTQSFVLPNKNYKSYYWAINSFNNILLNDIVQGPGSSWSLHPLVRSEQEMPCVSGQPSLPPRSQTRASWNACSASLLLKKCPSLPSTTEVRKIYHLGGLSLSITFITSAK